MKPSDEPVFEKLFNDAYQKFFSREMTTALSEIESKLFSDDILEDTGLLIDAEHIQNYSSFILATPESKLENPPVSTLDTLARYVVGAPHTDHLQRRQNESHYPYWFKYKDNFSRENPSENKKWLFPVTIIFIVLIVLAIIAVVFFRVGQTPYEPPVFKK